MQLFHMDGHAIFVSLFLVFVDLNSASLIQISERFPVFQCRQDHLNVLILRQGGLD